MGRLDLVHCNRLQIDARVTRLSTTKTILTMLKLAIHYILLNPKGRPFTYNKPGYASNVDRGSSVGNN